MEAVRKQAAKLREQVARQQQTVLKHLGHVSADAVVVDEEELHCHNKLQDLYTSTKATKRLQRNLVRGLEGFIVTSTKLVEMGRKLAEDCKINGDENQKGVLTRAAHGLGNSFKSMEDEREAVLEFLGQQVCDPIRGMINGASLEDARHLVHQYDRLRQEVETQAADVVRGRSKMKEYDISEENYKKLKDEESRLRELKISMKALGKEAAMAMAQVEDEQQTLTCQRLLALVEAERDRHRHALDILDNLFSEIVAEEDTSELSMQSLSVENVKDVLRPQEDNKSTESHNNNVDDDDDDEPSS